MWPCLNIKQSPEILEYVLQDADVVLAFTDGARRAALASHVPVIDFDDAGPGGFAARIAPAEFQHTPCARRCGADALHLRLHRQA
jgi:hypothetical protein